MNDKTLAKIVELVPARVILALSDSFAFSRMHAAGPKNPLHGITLEKMLVQLVEHYGWEMLGRMIQINCFNFHPSIKSSLTFLRRTPWARAKVEALYLDSLPDMQAPVPPEAEAAGPAAEGGEK